MSAIITCHGESYMPCKRRMNLHLSPDYLIILFDMSTQREWHVDQLFLHNVISKHTSHTNRVPLLKHTFKQS